ncbi:hypothetical protein NSTCB13_02929 [Nostoc sp. DSM 114160]|jgi:hypothetical protein
MGTNGSQNLAASEYFCQTSSFLLSPTLEFVL